MAKPGYYRRHALESQLDLGNGYGVVRHRDWRSYTDEVREIRKMTWALRQKVLGTEPPKPKDPSPPKNRRGPSVTKQPETDNGKRKTPPTKN
jgi:hypothetical protein